MEGEIGEKMKAFLLHLEKHRRTPCTINRHRLHLSGFLTSLNERGVESLAQISEKHIMHYISMRKADLSNCISTIRGVLRFWHSCKLVKDDYSELFMNLPVIKKEKIPSHYNKEEIITIETSICRSSPVGKRNYAILLLASRLGLRASDISNLVFSEIDWDTSKITLVMNKTGKLIELPLLPEVGNAIIDYLQFGRPKSQDQHVFLCSIPPYTQMGISGVSTVVSKIISQSPINVDGRHHGPHSMRHSLAACMLRNGETIPTIAEVLGHKHTQTTMSYLKIDMKSLLECALPVPFVEESFYTQKGGVFYE